MNLSGSRTVQTKNTPVIIIVKQDLFPRVNRQVSSSCGRNKLTIIIIIIILIRSFVTCTHPISFGQ